MFQDNDKKICCLSQEICELYKEREELIQKLVRVYEKLILKELKEKNSMLPEDVEEFLEKHKLENNIEKDIFKQARINLFHKKKIAYDKNTKLISLCC